MTIAATAQADCSYCGDGTITRKLEKPPESGDCKPTSPQSTRKGPRGPGNDPTPKLPYPLSPKA